MPMPMTIKSSFASLTLRAFACAGVALAGCGGGPASTASRASSTLRADSDPAPAAAPPPKAPPKTTTPTPTAPPAAITLAPTTVTATTSATLTPSAFVLGHDVEGAASAQYTLPPVFIVKSYGGKCLDFGAAPEGGAVVLRDCDGAASEQVLVEEVNARHEVVLHAGAKIIGISPATASALPTPAPPAPPDTLFASPIADTLLTVLDPADFGPSGPTTFALDGDSIILAGNRELVVKVQNGRGANGTPLVLAQRELADAEFWTFSSTFDSRSPTSGFQRVTAANFASAVAAAGPGSVLEIDPAASIALAQTVFVPGGVTIRGGRRGLVPGAKLWTDGAAPNGLLDVRDRDVRITGLRLRGPSADTDSGGVDARAIISHVQAGNLIIDHDELSQWTTAGVWVQEDATANTCDLNDSLRTLSTRVLRSYIHDNARQDAGYGVTTNYGGSAMVLGNTFEGNRHSIKSGAEPHTQYRAFYNLVLSYAPEQSKYGYTWNTQDFDVHGGGTDEFGNDGFGGSGGQYFEIARNTFLATDRQNFDLRGQSCLPVDFRENVSRESEDDAVACTDCNGGVVNVWGGSQFGHGDPTYRLGVGDFDGDGRQDLFLATGAAWYYAPGGQTEWRFLNARSETFDRLLFGDFDADGRTDVFAIAGANWLVSWGGASSWDTVNYANVPLDHLAVGNFVGDGRDDIFYADGARWQVSSGAREPFQLFDTSSYLIQNLRFGDFNHDGKTDVFGIANGSASVTYAGIINWNALPIGWLASIDPVVVADFNGDGTADVATSGRQNSAAPWTWSISYGGTAPWTDVGTFDVPLTDATAVGSFDDHAGADVVYWPPPGPLQPPSDALDVVSGGTGTPAPFGTWLR